MKTMRHSVRGFLAAALFAIAAVVLFVLSAARLSGHTMGKSQAIAAVASALSAFGFLLQGRS